MARSRTKSRTLIPVSKRALSGDRKWQRALRRAGCRDIRRELAAAGRRMRGDSDTEVLLEACALWGVEAAVERAIGMFAFALWDRDTRSLTLVRDRLGIKPLYYAATPERVLFASQLKAFRAAPWWKPTVDEDAVVGYLRHAYIAQPRTIYREAQKL